MAVITTDILLEGVGRETAFAWLCVPANHKVLLEGAFDGMVEEGGGAYTLTVATPMRRRQMRYRFEQPDDSHGGRRVLVSTSGKRFEGKLSYSLRTMKPSTNTLVTLHLDFDPGPAGALALRLGLEDRLRAALVRCLEALARAVPRGAGG